MNTANIDALIAELVKKSPTAARTLAYYGYHASLKTTLDDDELVEFGLVRRAYRVNRSGERKFCGRLTKLGSELGAAMRQNAMGCCRVERRCFVTHHTLSLETGTLEPTGRSEWQVKPCGVPLFRDDQRFLGICRSCIEGWTHEHNYATEAGRALLAAIGIEFAANEPLENTR